MGTGARAWLLGLALACLGACAPQTAQPPEPGAEDGAGTAVHASPAPAPPMAAPPAPAAPAPASATPEPASSAPSSPSPATPRSDSATTSEPLLTTCQTDTDCEVKDVGSCCGYRPACVNRDARTDPAAVQARCASEGRVGICGFREIEHCLCVSGSCQASPGADGPADPVGLQ